MEPSAGGGPEYNKGIIRMLETFPTLPKQDY